MAERSPLVVVGRIAGVYGVRGWLRVISHTAPRENIFGYRNWHLRLRDEWKPVELVEGRQQGNRLVAALETVTDRDQARTLIGADIAVPRSELPPAEAGEYYWADLEGLQVLTVDGTELGVVDHLFETGANDVMVVRGERERLVPFVKDQVVRSVDLEAGRITVDWDPEF